MFKKTLRHTDAAKPFPAPRPMEPLVVVATSFSPTEAQIKKGFLEESGIECFLADEAMAALDLPVLMMTKGIRIQVRESEAARALELLNAAEA